LSYAETFFSGETANANEAVQVKQLPVGCRYHNVSTIYMKENIFTEQVKKCDRIKVEHRL